MTIIIYGIFCKTTWNVYYGSTTKTLDERKQKHIYDYRAYLKGQTKYVTSYDIIKNNNYIFKIMEICNEKDRKKREGFYVRNFKCVNKCIPSRTLTEYFIEYNIINREKKSNYRKEYNIINREKKRKKDKDYYETNKEKISEKRNRKFTCECGSNYTHSNKSRHEKTQRHQNYKNLVLE